jgi:hypothetical protein
VIGSLCAVSWQVEFSQASKEAEPALQQFQRAIADYLALRARLSKEIVAPSPNATAAQISAASDALARAVQRARPKPPPGAFFDASAAARIRAKLRELLASNAALLEGIDDEVSTPRAPEVYARFPQALPIATMPPSLLAVLPTLPPELEYRLIGEDLVLRDVVAAMILDILPKAVSRN